MASRPPRQHSQSSQDPNPQQMCSLQQGSQPLWRAPRNELYSQDEDGDALPCSHLPIRAPPRLLGADRNARFREHFDVILLVDNREQFSRVNGSRIAGDVLAELNAEAGVVAEQRSLETGDALWIARRRSNPTEEYVLDYVLERKRVDDLAGSIRSKNRYAEQKYYMRASGLRRCLYLVEGDPDTLGSSSSCAAVKTASVQTEVFSGFTVVRTMNLHETRKYYACFTRMITEEVAGIWERAMQTGSEGDETLATWSQLKARMSEAKTLTVGMVWGLMLAQTPTLSGKVAEAITALYPTPKALIAEYEAQLRSRGEGAAREMFKDMRVPGLVKCLGKKKSSTIYDMVMGR